MSLYDLPLDREKSWKIQDSEQTVVSTGFVLWHLASFDAPTIAVVWTAFTAAVSHTVLPLAMYGAMGLAVWMLYVIDRLLDGRRLRADTSQGRESGIELRHLFHYQHRSYFLAGLAVSLAFLLFLLPQLSKADFCLYLVEAGFFSIYFGLIHSAKDFRFVWIRFIRIGRRYMSKELTVGPFFAAAVSIPTLSRSPAARLSLLPMGLLFAMLCSLNCLYIYAWEHPDAHKGNRTTLTLIRHLSRLTTLFVAISVVCCLPIGAIEPVSLRLYPLACAGSALLLWTIHRFHARLSPVTRRTAADAALLTPVLLLPFLYQ